MQNLPLEELLTLKTKNPVLYAEHIKNNLPDQTQPLTLEVAQAIDALQLNKVEAAVRAFYDWPEKLIQLASLGFKQFMKLTYIYKGTSVPPSNIVDEFWHVYQLMSADYQKEVLPIFSNTLEHCAMMGNESEKTYTAFTYAAQTSEFLHELHFGEESVWKSVMLIPEELNSVKTYHNPSKLSVSQPYFSNFSKTSPSLIEGENYLYDEMDLSDVASRIKSRRKWSDEEIHLVIADYKEFLHRCLLNPNDPPSCDHQAVAIVWQVHLLRSSQYKNDCAHIFGRYLQHRFDITKEWRNYPLQLHLAESYDSSHLAPKGLSHIVSKYDDILCCGPGCCGGAVPN